MYRFQADSLKNFVVFWFQMEQKKLNVAPVRINGIGGESSLAGQLIEITF